MLFVYQPKLKKIFTALSFLFVMLPKAASSSETLSDWDIAKVPSPQITAKILSIKIHNDSIFLLDEKGSLMRGHEKLAEFNTIYSFSVGNIEENEEIKPETEEVLNFEMLDQFVEDEIDRLKSQGYYFDETEKEEEIRSEIDEENFKTKIQTDSLIDEKAEQALSLTKARLFLFKDNLIAFYKGEFVHFKLSNSGPLIRGKRSGIVDLKCKNKNCIFASLDGVFSYDLLSRTERFLHPLSSSEKDALLAINEAEFFFADKDTLFSCDLNGKINKRQAVKNDLIEIYSSRPNELIAIGPNWISWKEPGKSSKFVNANFFSQRIFNIIKKESSVLLVSDSGLWKIDSNEAERLRGIGWPDFFIAFDSKSENFWLADDEGNLMLAAKGKRVSNKILRRFWRNFIIKDPPLAMALDWHRKANGNLYKKTANLKKKLFLTSFFPELQFQASFANMTNKNESPKLVYDIDAQPGSDTDISEIESALRGAQAGSGPIDVGSSEVEILERNPGTYYRDNIYWQASLNWDFAGLLFNPEKIRLSKSLSPVYKQQRRSSQILAKSFFRRRALQLKTAMEGGDLKNLARIEELSSILNAMTGYCFKPYMRGKTERCEF